ncbi:hypothetical protein HOM50_05145 [bacterium]|nr:hypothetical protein [bacterium]MBT5015767.1 hypothetical protein [bacterium]
MVGDTLYGRTDEEIEFCPVTSTGVTAASCFNMQGQKPSSMSVSPHISHYVQGLRVLHAGTRSGSVKSFSSQTGQDALFDTPVFSGPVTSVATQGKSADDGCIYAASEDTVKVIDVKTMKENPSLELGVGEKVLGMHANDSGFLVVRTSKQVLMFRRNESSPTAVHTFASPVVDAVNTPHDGQTLFVATGDHHLHMRNYAQTRESDPIAGSSLTGDDLLSVSDVMSIAEDHLLVADNGEGSSFVRQYGLMDESAKIKKLGKRVRSLSHATVGGKNVAVVGGDNGQVRLLPVLLESEES